MQKFVRYIPLNLDLMANPYNWIIIPLMVLFAAAALQFLVQSATASTGDESK